MFFYKHKISKSGSVMLAIYDFEASLCLAYA